MRGMYNRQATRLILLLSLLPGLWACSPSNQSGPTPSLVPPTATRTSVPPLPTLPSITLTPTPLTCLSQPGELQNGEVPTEGRPTAFIIYLPPCYDQLPEQHYPVLYLLHGQTYTADQWVRLGAPAAADRLIHSGQSVPFIIVFPEDRYWNIQQGMYFGQYLLNDVIPYIDSNFRTLPDRAHRAIGGLSRGGGWAFEVGVSRPDLFGSLGLHSPAILATDRASATRWIRELSPELWPRLYIDMGDNDRESEFNIRLEAVLTEYEIPHEWHLNTGAHDEAYWSEHVNEYIQWYAAGWP
jgi:enterochelin esterase-like enzyme